MTARDEGTVALLGLLTASGVAVVALIGVVALADLALTSGRATAAADAAALAAVGAHPLAGGAGDGETAAARYAEANGASLEALDHDGLRATVEVRAEPATPLVRAVVPAVPAGASAELVPVDADPR